jgi:hypothetical protein
MQVPHPLLRKPHSISGATVSAAAASKAGIQLPVLPRSALQARPASALSTQVAAAIAEAGKQHSPDQGVGSIASRAALLSAEHAVGVPVPRSALLSHTLACFLTEQGEDQQADRQQGLSAHADEAPTRAVVETAAHAGTSAAARSHCTVTTNHTWETAVVSIRDVKGAEEWCRCSGRLPPPDVMLSRLREHACCKEIGVDPVHPFPEVPSAEGLAVGSYHATTSHCTVLLSVGREGSRLQSQNTEV